MWLLLRMDTPPDGILKALRSLAIEAQAHRLGNRWAIELQGNGYLPEMLLRYEEVERILPDDTPYPLVQRWNGSVELPSWKRREKLLWIAGPCSVENKAQLLSLAQDLKSLGVHVLRGGAFKARTSPYSFQGLGEVALEWLLEARSLIGLPICVEILSEKHLPLYEQVDILQIGARNMDHYWLLKEVGSTQKPVLLKRNPQATIEEWLLAAEYLLLHGSPWVLLCERGIRTFERSTRYMLDVGAIPVVQRQTLLPVIADPSHAAGHWRYVEPLALSAVGAGAEGLIVEVHPDPLQAQSDSAQQLTLDQFILLYQRANALFSARLGHLTQPV
ncbi:MAG: 3-deoxy-7-phosphoheptulonate synthase [Bacteroidia bacterium]|nr:3-deoxy-7-phosphoheptulonate synthase [Bacteroidia bacterium]